MRERCIYEIHPKQIEEFTFNVASKMLMMQHFCHTPSATNSPSKKIEYGGLAGLMLENC
jgi:hypothetical protein